MAEAIYGWIKNLAFYFIFITVILNFLPDGQYRSYVKSFLGMLLLLVVLKPVFSLLGMSGTLAENLRTESVQGELREMEEQARLFGGETDQYYLDAIAREIERQVEEAANARGLTADDVRAELKDGGGEVSLLSARVGGDGRERAEFKEELMETYGLLPAQVQLTADVSQNAGKEG